MHYEKQHKNMLSNKMWKTFQLLQYMYGKSFTDM